MSKVDFVKKLKNARKVVAITGAGISAESGIPTFRGAGGLWLILGRNFQIFFYVEKIYKKFRKTFQKSRIILTDST